MSSASIKVYPRIRILPAFHDPKLTTFHHRTTTTAIPSLQKQEANMLDREGRGGYIPSRLHRFPTLSNSSTSLSSLVTGRPHPRIELRDSEVSELHLGGEERALQLGLWMHAAWLEFSFLFSVQGGISSGQMSRDGPAVGEGVVWGSGDGLGWFFWRVWTGISMNATVASLSLCEIVRLGSKCRVRQSSLINHKFFVS